MSETLPGVYYDVTDQVGLIRRLLIDFIDGMVLVVACVGTFVAFVLIGSKSHVAYFAMVLGISFAYMVLWKRFGRTLGYIVCGAQLVSVLDGKPSIWALTLRSLFLLLGPRNSLLDLIWLSSDPHRQAIRDKMAQTYVVRKGSLPEGRGRIRYVRLDILGYLLLLPEVARDGDAHAGSK